MHLSSVVVYGYRDASEQDESAHMRTYGVPYLDTKTASERIARRRAPSSSAPATSTGRARCRG